MLVVSGSLASSCTSCRLDSPLTLGGCLNGFISIDVSLLKPSQVMNLIRTSFYLHLFELAQYFHRKCHFDFFMNSCHGNQSCHAIFIKTSYM